MPFNPNDIYTSSGSVKLYNSWTPYVSKYDTSSFYNWEQDNLPLYDLEERTYELWEQGGFATSSVNGLALTVSADAPDATLAANRNIFTSVSACIAAIPKVVRFPVLIEVANFGNMGNLELNNFRIEEGGSIEIINRSYGRFYSASSVLHTVLAGTYSTGISFARAVSSLDLSSSLINTSCINIQTPVLSSTNPVDARCRAAIGNHIVYPINNLRRGNLTCSLSKNQFNFATTDLNAFGGIVFENETVDETIASLDISSTNTFTGERLNSENLNTAIFTQMTGNLYLNRLTKLSVRNCTGPIYIRNFLVNSTNAENYGIEIENSEVVLENCASVRNKLAGFKFNNSKVTISRSAFAYRNYNLLTTTTREEGTGIGFDIINSEVLVSSLPIAGTATTVGDTGASACDCVVVASRNAIGFNLENSKLVGGIARTSLAEPRTESIIASESNTSRGITCINSNINLGGLIDIYGNDVGIELDNSYFQFEHLCVESNQSEGILANNSKILYDSDAKYTSQSVRKQLDMLKNGQHIVLNNNSIFDFTIEDHTPELYGNSLFVSSHGVNFFDDSNRFAYPAIEVNQNSTLNLINPAIYVNSLPLNIANIPSYGRAIKVTNNSKVSLFGTKTGCSLVLGPPEYTMQQKMCGVYANNNSIVNLHGPTAIGQFGVDVLVEDNSTLNIEPYKKNDCISLEVSAFDLSSGENHTAVELHATRACLVANKNSNINLRDLGSFVSNWDRSITGQTYVDSTDYDTITYGTSGFTSFGCLQFYPNPQESTIVTTNSLDDITAALTVNPFVDNPTFSEQTGMLNFFVKDDPLGGAPDYTERAKITQGGVCVRATQDSIVNVTNVHFPLGSNNSPLDAFYYNASGNDCSKLMIWNIADTSKLNAALLSVSGMHPADTQYHGPSAFWTSSINGTSVTYVPASGAPSRTPDTGSLSIFDMFGAGSAIWVVPSGVSVNSPFNSFYPISGVVNSQTMQALAGRQVNVDGRTAYVIGSAPGTSKNQGVFRIYWSPKASARVLQIDDGGYFKGSYPHSGPVFSGVVGPAYQIFAQGYNCSAPLSAVPVTGQTNASSVYPDLLKLSFDSNGDGVPDRLWTSGFYYCSEMLEENPTQCILDDSAGKTFANAQNASVGLAGRPKKVTLYQSQNSNSIDSESYVGNTSSLGFKSALIFDLSRDN
jgi:hypothetical protein